MLPTSRKSTASPVSQSTAPKDTHCLGARMAPPPHESTLPAFSSDCARRVTGAAACAAFTSNLDAAEKKEMNGQCAEALKGKEHFVATVADALNSAEGHSALPGELERTNEMYACGFEAMKQGRITDEQFATLCLFENTKQHNENATVMSLFHPDGSRNEEAIALLRSTFLPSTGSGSPTHKYGDLKPEEEEQFLKLVAELSPSERQFVTYQTANDSELYKGLFNLELPFLEGIKPDDSTAIMKTMPSFGMMQALLKVKCPNVRLKPGFGAFVLKTLYENNRAGVREMAIPFPYLPARFGAFGLPSEADGLSLNFAAEFSLHDFYHALLMGNIPRKEILALSEIGWYLNQTGIEMQQRDEEKEKGQFLEKTGEGILDMELRYYSRYFGVPNKEALRRMIQNELREVDTSTLERIDIAILSLMIHAADLLEWDIDDLETFIPIFKDEYLQRIRSLCAECGVKLGGDWRLTDGGS